MNRHEPSRAGPACSNDRRASARRRWRALARTSAARAGLHGSEDWLVARGLRRAFKGRVVVEDVSLALRRGEAVGLLGPNGAGKTTVFYMITGLIRADGGRIELDGDDITHLPMYQRARLGVGYLPQEASIFRGLSVEDNIRAVLEIVEPDRARREDDLDALLEEFHIAHLRKSPVDRALRRRAAALRDRPRAGQPARLHAARRALRRHRPDRRRRHPGAGPPPDAARHRRAHHRPQRARDAAA